MSTTFYEVTAFRLNLRAAPDTSAPIVAVMPQGQAGIGTGPVRAGWVPLAWQGRRGFASAAFLRAFSGSPLPAAPAPAPSAGALVDVNAKERDLVHLHPRFRALLSRVLAELHARSLPFRVFEAYRQPERQAWLFAQGRTRPGAKVTNAQAWQSWHQYGVAADLVLFEAQGWSWDDSGARAAAWRDMQSLAQAAGLKTLSFERPHVELNGAEAEWTSGALLATGDESWRAHLEAAADRWRAVGGTGAPAMAPADAERPPLDAQATT